MISSTVERREERRKGEKAKCETSGEGKRCIFIKVGFAFLEKPSESMLRGALTPSALVKRSRLSARRR
jgi:hypothetical protein